MPKSSKSSTVSSAPLFPAPALFLLPGPLPLGSYVGIETLLCTFSFIVYPEPGTDGVQGVGFRKASAKYATAHGITGWVRNNSSSMETVEGIAEGSPTTIAEFKIWLSEVGSPRSVIGGASFTDSEMGVARRRQRIWKSFTVKPTTK